MEPYEHYVIQIEDLEVRIPYERISDTLIRIPNPRPLRMDDSLDEEYMINLPFVKFINDIQAQIPPQLEGRFIEVAFESLYIVVLRHIQSHQQVNPSDLELMIAENILLYNSIREASKNGSFTNLEMESIFSSFHKQIIELLPPNLSSLFSK